MLKFAFEISGTFNHKENRDAFRIANDTDGTARYGGYPQNVIVSRHIDAHNVFCCSDDGDFAPIKKALSELNPLDVFWVWDTPNTRLSDMMHPLHIIMFYKNYLAGSAFVGRDDGAVRYFGGFEYYTANEIYHRCRDEELSFTMDDCVRYVKACVRLVKQPFNPLIPKKPLPRLNDRCLLSG